MLCMGLHTTVQWQKTFAGWSTSNVHLLWYFIAYDRLSGTIPSELGNLEMLTELHLGKLFLLIWDDNFEFVRKSSNERWIFIELVSEYNKLHGTIPIELGRLNNLKHLSLCKSILKYKILWIFYDFVWLQGSQRYV